MMMGILHRLPDTLEEAEAIGRKRDMKEDENERI